MMREDSARPRIAIGAALIAWLVGCNAPARSIPAPTDPSLREAHDALMNGRFEEAQDLYARATARSNDSAEAWLGFGESSWRLFEAAVADPSKGNAGYFLADAARGYQRACDLDPDSIGAQLGASRIAREKSDGESAARHAQTARDRVGKDSPPEERFDVLLELGRGRALQFQAAARANAVPTLQADYYQRAKDSFYSAAKVLPDRPEPIVEFARFEAARGDVTAASDVLASAIREHPEQGAYHETMRNVLVPAGGVMRLNELYSGLERDLERSATTAWFAGYARILQAEDLRRKGDGAAAAASYDAAMALFRKSRDLNATYKKESQYWEAFATAGQARLLFEDRKIAEAVVLLTNALTLDLAILDQADGLGITAKRTTLEIGGEYFQAGELAQGAQIFERWLELRPDDVDWLNNAGLFRRDLGEGLARESKTDEATKCFEASYRHYRKVADLQPDEPRIVNDCALILLYHLNRDLDSADEMFRRAIRLGESRLEELGGARPAVSEEEPDSAALARQWDYFAEATGDAYQNLGLLLEVRGGDAAQIRKLWERSLELDPRGTRARMRGWIDALPASGPASKPTRLR
ncbi:MAG TPA: hypothetical protein VKE69_04630 [Planctomycetota bacterium]|nr:hypothetical protein [Planctomycetota bacterium]